MVKQRILITGSSGLIGTAVTQMLTKQGAEVVLFDVAATGTAHGDVRDFARVQEAITGCTGVLHLAAISRVIWGERNPDLCWTTNVDGLENVVAAAVATPAPPWLIFASSREVYGQPAKLPVDEDCPLAPVNIYGRAKVEGERCIVRAQRQGLVACTVRLSNVFGSTGDHVDRVVPAFARGAALGQELRVDGADHTFDFTHISDVGRGLVTLIEQLSAGQPAPPPIHFVTGQATTLEQLARLAIRIAQTSATIRMAPPRDFDVARFVGSYARAHARLGWTPEVDLEEGLTQLIRAFQREGPCKRS